MSRESVSGFCLWFVALSIGTAFGQVQSRPAPSGERNSTSASPEVAATAGQGQVRFAALGVALRIRLEVLDQAGGQVYDSGFRDGTLLDWKIEDRHGRLLPDGLYGCVVTVEDVAGLPSRRSAAFWVLEGAVRFAERAARGAGAVEGQDSIAVLLGGEALPITQVAHDGANGLVASGRGGLSFRTGDLLAGKDVEHVRLTSDGKLGIGTEEPVAKLDVDGLIRTSEGIQFPDGTIQKTAARPGAGAAMAPLIAPVEARSFTMAVGRKSASSDAASIPTGRGPGRIFGTEGTSSTFYGVSSGGSITTGDDDSFFGAYAGSSNTTGSNNSFFGYASGSSNTTGSDNSFFGRSAGYFNTTGGLNSFFGRRAGDLNTTGFENSFFGAYAGYSNTTGFYNSSLGFYSGYANTTGSLNTFLGYNSGSPNTTESNNTFLGALSNGASAITNATAVGYRAQVAASNSLVLGSINGVNGAASDTFVGIGTTTPDRLLVLEGAQALSRMTRYNETGPSFAAAYLCERGRGTRAAPLDILPGDHLGKVQFRGRVGGTMQEYGVFSFVAADTAQNGRFGFFDPGAVNERVSILTTGNVGIGTTAPTERLHVAGNIRLSGTIITSAPLEPVPDYVFEPSYKLMPIEELGRYVARERHLPKVPAAREIQEKGLDLGAFQMRLLEKIEELTLYTVEQAKTIRALESNNAGLQARLEVLERKIGKGSNR